MAYARGIRAEHKKACRAISDLLKKNDGHTPLPKDNDTYFRLVTIKRTLEWVHPVLIKTKAKGHARHNELMGHRHYAFGPTHAVLYP